MMFFVLFAAAMAVSDAMVCFHGICDHLEKQQPPLQCKGSVVKNGGFCGCYDVCAKQEGEECQSSVVRGRIPLGSCDKGLKCQHEDHMIIGAGKCVKEATVDTTKKERSTTQTLCQRERIHSMIVMIVYKGQWFPRCDAEGLFQPEQCDNTGTCFCVDIKTGVVDESTKVLGSANCQNI